MKLKTKLKIVFCTLIIVPVILILVILFVGGFRLKEVYRDYKIETETYDTLFNPMLVYEAFNSKIQNELQQIAETNPDTLCDVDYIEEYVKDYADSASDIIIRLDDEYIYTGDISKEDFGLINSKLQHISAIKHEVGGSIYLGDVQLLINYVDFVNSRGENGCVYVVTKIDYAMPQVKELVVALALCLVIILVGISICMTAWIYKGIITPINKLKRATQSITEGNLDFNFSLATDRADEIGALCNDFELMRKRLKESTEQQLQNDKDSKELISNISHDLKTPITAIKGYVEGIMDGIADTPEKMERYIKTIYNKTIDMDRLINELTLYSKIDNNKIPYNFNKINVFGYFEDCVDEIKTELDSKNIELGYFNYTEKNTTIIADPEQLKRVINNIISNSVKYIATDRKGIINIRIKDVDDFVQFEIEDNGKGIAQKDIQYIFDRFYRTDSSRNSSQGGSGIGLSIVKKIINDHGGQIWASSKEGTGTIMYFVLRKYIEEPRK